MSPLRRERLAGFRCRAAELAHKAEEGRLRINAPMSLGLRVPQILSGFRERYPKINVEISRTDRILDMVDAARARHCSRRSSSRNIS